MVTQTLKLKESPIEFTTITDSRFREYLITFGWMNPVISSRWDDEFGFYTLLGFYDKQSNFKLLLMVTKNHFYEIGCTHNFETLLKRIGYRKEKCTVCGVEREWHSGD